MVAGLVLDLEAVRKIHFVVAQVHIAIPQVHGEVVSDVVGHTSARVPGEGGAVLIEVGIEALSGKRIVGVIEGHAQTGAHIGSEGRAVAEVIVEIQEQRGSVPGALEIKAVIVVPAFFTVAAQGIFHFRAHGNAKLTVEVVAQRQSAAQSELAVMLVRLIVTGLERGVIALDAHQEFGSQVHAGTFGLGHTGKGQGADQGQGGKTTFHAFLLFLRS